MDTHLIVITNGLKSNEEWVELDHQGKVVWLASLNDLEVRAQASVRASYGSGSIQAVLRAWATCGYLSFERMLAVLRAEVAP